MNLFVRYFNNETLAHNAEEAIAFLNTIGEIKVDESAFSRVSEFYKSANPYPFRLKVSYNNYVLFLKTDASTLEEFHKLEAENKAVKTSGKVLSSSDKKRIELQNYSKSKPGWYEATIVFKRVIVNSVTNKCHYADTTFSARCKADSTLDCYSRVIDHLKARPELDPRCQYPSIRSNNFTCNYIGA